MRGVDDAIEETASYSGRARRLRSARRDLWRCRRGHGGGRRSERGRRGGNSFATSISGSGISVQVALISSYPAVQNGICIDAQLGSGGCPTAGTNLPGFLHVDQEVDSRNALDLVLSTYAQWQTVSRSFALKHVIVVSDDNSDMTASAFDTQFKALDASHAGYKFHGIYAFTPPYIAPSDPCYSIAAAEGTVYRELVQMTGGVSGNLCLQDSSTDSANMASAIAAATPVSCEIGMPTTDAGAIDAATVKLEFSTVSSAIQTWTT
jgi:hypothetical protein